jgi:threonine/homoserine/homoserine lactone efflux protein
MACRNRLLGRSGPSLAWLAVDLVASLPAFVAAVVLISASPGPAMALTVRRAAQSGWRGAVPTVLGLEAGLFVWALAAAGGFAALVAASEVAFTVLRVVGASFLLFLGTRALVGAWRRRPGDDGGPAADPAALAGRRGWARAFGEGAVVQLANPKAAVLMLALYPQFVPPDRPLFVTTSLLALIQVTIETGLYLALAAGVGRAGDWFRRPVIRRRTDALMGTVLVGLGLRVAAARR